jgi:hypothetical protein
MYRLKGVFSSVVSIEVGFVNEQDIVLISQACHAKYLRERTHAQTIHTILFSHTPVIKQSNGK